MSELTSTNTVSVSSERNSTLSMVEFDQLWQHQKDAVIRARDVDNLGLFMDAGVGKTGAMINILREHYSKSQKIVPTLILSPIAVVHQWKSEFIKFSHIPQFKIFVCYDTGAKRLNAIIDAIESTKGECIIITNYETLQMDKCMAEFLNWRPSILVCDESHRCKSPTAKRSKKVQMLADRAKNKYLLTGTPITNSPMDIFMQFRILDGGKTFGDNFFVFRSLWFDNVLQGTRATFPKFELKPYKAQEMNRLIYKSAVRAVKSECLDLPPFVKTKIEVDLSKEQKRLYEEMRKHFITFIDSEHAEPQAVVAQQAVTKALRMQQIVTGFVKTEAGEIKRIKENPRLDALEDLLEDLTINHKVIVWCCFKENYVQVKEVCEKLKIQTSELTGETKDREAQIQKFRNDADCRVLISNQSAGGIGVNLVEASYAIYFSKNFSLEHDVQSEARNYRGGSHIHDKITRIDLVAKNTIDDLITKALENKQDLINNIVELRKQLDFELS